MQRRRYNNVSKRRTHRTPISFISSWSSEIDRYTGGHGGGVRMAIPTMAASIAILQPQPGDAKNLKRLELNIEPVNGDSIQQIRWTQMWGANITTTGTDTLFNAQLPDTPGTYTVRAVVTTTQGREEVLVQHIRVEPEPFGTPLPPPAPAPAPEPAPAPAPEPAPAPAPEPAPAPAPEPAPEPTWEEVLQQVFLARVNQERANKDPACPPLQWSPEAVAATAEAAADRYQQMQSGMVDPLDLTYWPLDEEGNSKLFSYLDIEPNETPPGVKLGAISANPPYYANPPDNTILKSKEETANFLVDNFQTSAIHWGELMNCEFTHLAISVVATEPIVDNGYAAVGYVYKPLN